MRQLLHRYHNEVNRNLRVRGIIFDIDVLTFELKQPKEDRAVPEVTVEKKVEYDKSKDIVNVTTVQTKYMNKIRSKLGTLPPKTLGDTTKISDGNILTTLKGLTSNQSNKPSRWLLSSGMGDLLDYSSNRTIKLSLIGHKDKAEPNNLSDQLQQQLTPEIRFVGVVNADLELADSLSNYCETLENAMKLLPNTLLLVSGRDDLLACAKQRGYYTCKFRYFQIFVITIN